MTTTQGVGWETDANANDGAVVRHNQRATYVPGDSSVLEV